MFINIMYLILIIILLPILGVALVACAHPKCSLSENIRIFKKNVYIGLRTFFSTEVMRHEFEIPLVDDLIKVFSGIHHTAFTPVFQRDFIENVPVFKISLVLSKKLEQDEYLNLCRLVQLKFSEYLELNRFNWMHFIEYHVVNETLVLYIFYSEFKEDAQPFKNRYHKMVRRLASKDFGVLRDEALEKELKDVK